jgi:glycosyltransferase involved in cell wall biosynthesis
MKALFLYTELADYTMACLRALKNSDTGVEIMVIHYPVNPEAPFKLDSRGVGQFISITNLKTDLQLIQVVKQFDPGIIISSGWSNKRYLMVCRKYKNRIRTVLTMDNHWQGSIRQRVLSVIAKFYFSRIFDCCWVPGDPQVQYAKKLGFRSDKIFRGFYCCYQNNFPKKKVSIPKRMICVARYIPSKNYSTLWNAFIRWQDGQTDKWELWCAGTGSEFHNRRQHPAIRHLGFVSPEDWDAIVSETGVFILPSLFEPWGVVVQEFAAAGFPLILSETVGAATQFLNGSNGFTFDPKSEYELVECFNKISFLSVEELGKMAEVSNVLANSISFENWCSTIKLMNEE